jgi:hypothetical protein
LFKKKLILILCATLFCLHHNVNAKEQKGENSTQSCTLENRFPFALQMGENLLISGLFSASVYFLIHQISPECASLTGIILPAIIVLKEVLHTQHIISSLNEFTGHST